MKDIDTVKELVQIARDGAEFYDDARKEVEDPELKNVFRNMTDHKLGVIGALSGQLAMMAEGVPESGTLVGTLRKVYADVRANLSSNEDKVYVVQLEEVEDRLLHHFEDAVKTVENSSIRSSLLEQMPQVRACHDQMRSLKQRMAA